MQKTQGYHNITMCHSIKETLGNVTPDASPATPVLFQKLSQSCSKVALTPELYERIRKAAKKSPSLVEYHNACIDSFGALQGYNIYMETRKVWKELRA